MGLEFRTPTRVFYATAGPAFAFHDDHRIANRSRLRVGMDYDATWLVRPIITNPTLLQTTPSGRQRQDHIRLSIGITWSIR